MARPEYEQQVRIFQWIAQQNQKHQQDGQDVQLTKQQAEHLNYAFATLNGMFTTKRHAFDAKRAGARKGTPDIVIPTWGNQPTLYIEFKRLKGGRLSTDQKRYLTHLNATGSWAFVAKGTEAAIELISAYMHQAPLQNLESINNVTRHQ